MDRNDWSRLIVGRDRGDVVQRAAGRQWLRWWGLGGVFLAIAVFAPLAAANSYSYDQKLRELGQPREVRVIAVEPTNVGSTFTVRLDDRDVALENPKLVPKVGDEVTVVVNPAGRVVLADDIGAKNKAVGDALFGVFLAFVVFIGLGWGPGMAPYRAMRSIRRPDKLEQSTIVRMVEVAKATPPQGRLWAGWRRGTGQFYRATLVMPDRRRVLWQGRLPRPVEDGTKVRVVGGGFDGDWVALVVNVKGTTEEAVCWPAARLRDAK
ncbi:MAG: hypothetical protein ACT4QF_06440 [Sporichthyaceae bacterium]